jgi:hypothetical protein
MLKKATDYAKLTPTDATAVAGVASAYACKYAVTGTKEFRKQALEQLDRASKLVRPANAAEFRDYVTRIHHRLDTREVITRSEFHRRYPAGYRSKS